MSGFGLDPFGLFPFGYWEPEQSTQREKVLSPARYIDPVTKDLAVSNGRFLGMGKTAQKVLLALSTRLGSIPGMPLFGVDFKNITHANEELKTKVTDSVNKALSFLVQANEIKILSVDLVEQYGSNEIQVTYINLLEEREETVSV